MRQLRQELGQDFLVAKLTAHAKCNTQTKFQNANEAAHLALTVRVSRTKRLLTPAPLGPDVSYSQGAVCVWAVSNASVNTFSPEPYALLQISPPLTVILGLS